LPRKNRDVQRDKSTAENVQQKRHMEAYIQNARRQTGYRQKRRHKGRDIRAQLSMWSRHRYEEVCWRT
jgi:hypothetical protein